MHVFNLHCLNVLTLVEFCLEFHLAFLHSFKIFVESHADPRISAKLTNYSYFTAAFSIIRLSSHSPGLKEMVYLSDRDDKVTIASKTLLALENIPYT